MATDPYAQCPCGSGKKVKYCCSKLQGEIDRVVSLFENKQEQQAMAALEKLSASADAPESSRMYAETARAQFLSGLGDLDQAQATVDKIIEKYPNFGLPREVKAELLIQEEDFIEALESYRDALSHYPPDAVEHRARTLLKIGIAHNYQGRPLASWAAWQQALKVLPGFTPATEATQQFIHENHLLPNPARHGLALKSPDDLAVFNEERRQKWNAALADMNEFHLDDLVAAFNYLAHDDTSDVNAWYNLGLAYAWTGDNVKAIEALEKYVEQETDFEAATNAWDLAEVLRLGAGAEELSDNLHQVAVYEVPTPDALFAKLKAAKNILVMQGQDGRPTLHWLDRDVPDPNSPVPLLGGTPRQIAQILLYPRVLEIVATTADRLREARTKFDLLVGTSASLLEEHERPGPVQTIDSEPFLRMPGRGEDENTHRQNIGKAIEEYWEEDWLRRPLKSLGGLTPLDAAQSPKFRKRIEGIIRFRERSFAQHLEAFRISYDFGRLRNKLGLEVLASTKAGEVFPGAAVKAGTNVASYSAAQLATLEPNSLPDEELAAAYRSANSLDIPQTSLKFAEAMINRGSLAAKLDMTGIFRRLVNDALERKNHQRAAELASAAKKYDESNYDSKHRNDLELLEAKVLFAGGRKEEAVASLRTLLERAPDDLALIATTVENLLSAGVFAPALEFAKSGLQKAEQRRHGEFQGQFKDYIKSASARMSS